MKRLYKLVSIKKESSGYGILLDNRPVKTKNGTSLLAPSEEFANKIMVEWAEQGEKIIPDTMPLTQILSTKIDRVSTERKKMSETLQKYLDTDLLCYHAFEPDQLVALQNKHWNHWLDWFEVHYGYILETTTGLSAIKHSADAHLAVQNDIKNMDDNHFTILQLITSISGSLILGLAFTKQEASSNDVFNAHYLEENFKDNIYNADKYGPDPMTEKAQKAAMVDLVAAQEYLRLIT